METALAMLKIDLGISHTVRDEYFSSLLNGCKSEIEAKGVPINFDDTEDIMLLVDYSAWRYRKRMEDTLLPNNLRCRIMNAKIKERASDA